MQPARILVVDDEAPNRTLLRRVLEHEGYEVCEATNGVEAITVVQRERPDVVLLDAVMPVQDGFVTARKLKSDPATRLIPVVMVTTLDALAHKLRAVDLGVDDFLAKPVNLAELTTRVRSLVAVKRFTDELEHASRVLEGLAGILEQRDGYTGEHCQRVGAVAHAVGQSLGCDESALAAIRLGGILHDLGKVAVPDAVLRKPGRLEPAELEAMRVHAAIGASICLPMRTMERAGPILRHHHERLDGSGYPDGLRGEAISLEVRIVTVVDIYDALTTRRPYREPLVPDRALTILREESERGWWDSNVIACLSDLLADGRVREAAEGVEAAHQAGDATE